MIRNIKYEDLDLVMELWLASNLDAHSFIPPEFWKNNCRMVREAISKADVCVYEDNGRIDGFAGVTDGYLAGIFVRKERRSAGIGTQLLNHCKRKNDRLTLHVYKKNVEAYRFYKREGFLDHGIRRDPVTGEEEYCQIWEARLV